jgi:HD-like signal output (HDOD) protein/ActR/RegA family two-component response regulator
MKNVLFVDDEPKVLQGLERQLRSLRHEWSFHFAPSGPQALEFLAAAPVDVIVSDMMMPGMDGAELLTEVMRRFPRVVRLVLSGQSEREGILRLVGPAHQYLSKPCTAEELRAVIGRALALRDLLSDPSLRELVSGITSLPSVPALYAQLNEELRQAEPSISRIVEIVSKDAGMAAKLLQIVNSAFFGLPQRAADVAEAVQYLGLATLQALVLSAQAFSQVDAGTIRRFALADVEQHSWLTGLLARQIAQAEHCDTRTADQCFLAGLLHDAGHLVLAAALPGRYQRVLLAAQGSGRPVWEAERTEFGAGHAEVGAYLFGLWGLPDSVVEAVALHHRPADSPAGGFSPTLAVHVADALNHDHCRLESGPTGYRLDREYLGAQGLLERLEDWTKRWQERDFES